MMTLLALTEQRLGNDIIRGIGNIGIKNGTADSGIPLFVDIMSKIIGILTISAILWFIIQFIMGAFRWISSSGDAKSLESARGQIIHAIVGLVLVFAALVILSVIAKVFGVNFIDLENVIRNLNPGAVVTGPQS